MQTLPLALALSLSAATAVSQQAPPCRPLTVTDVKQPLTLSAPCYAVNRLIDIHAPVTVAAGTKIIFGQGDGFVIGGEGSLTAAGTGEKPVILTGKQHTRGFWFGLNFNNRSELNRLSYVTVEDAGSQGTSDDDGAVLVSVGARLAIEHTTIRNAKGNALNLMNKAVLGVFEANNFEKNDASISLKASDLSMLDGASTFSGNGRNYIRVRHYDPEIEKDQTWHALQVPYYFEGTPSITAHLTIEAGATLEFGQGNGIDIREGGSLTAEGSADHRIVFTGAEKAPGFWEGIYFYSNTPKNVIRNAVIEYGGLKGNLGNAGVCIGQTGSAAIAASELTYNPTAGIRVVLGGKLNADAATSNTFRDNGTNIVYEK